MPNPRFKFSPGTRSSSGLLQLAAGYFVLNGILYALLLVFALMAYSLEWEAGPKRIDILRVSVSAISAVGLVATGVFLWRAARVGAYLALGFLILPVVVSVITGQRIGMVTIVFTILGVIVLTSIWHELKSLDG